MKWIISLIITLLIALAIGFGYIYMIEKLFVVEAKTIYISARVENKLKVLELPYDGQRLQPATNLWSLR